MLRRRLDEMEEAWRSLNAKLDRLELYIQSIPSAQSTSTANNNHTPLHVATSLSSSRPIGIHELFTTLHWHSIAFNERVFNISSDLGYPDPVLHGLVTMEQMEMAFHL